MSQKYIPGALRWRSHKEALDTGWQMRRAQDNAFRAGQGTGQEREGFMEDVR